MCVLVSVLNVCNVMFDDVIWDYTLSLDRRYLPHRIDTPALLVSAREFISMFFSLCGCICYILCCDTDIFFLFICN